MYVCEHMRSLQTNSRNTPQKTFFCIRILPSLLFFDHFSLPLIIIVMSTTAISPSSQPAAAANACHLDRLLRYAKICCYDEETVDIAYILGAELPTVIARAADAASASAAATAATASAPMESSGVAEETRHH
jgi:hypothetical protein